MSKTESMQYLAELRALTEELRDAIPTHAPVKLYESLSYPLSLEEKKRMTPKFISLTFNTFKDGFIRNTDS